MRYRAQLFFRKNTLSAAAVLLFLFVSVLSSALPVRADREPLPNNSTDTALFFGDIAAPLAPNLTPPPQWESGMRRDFNVLDIAAGVMERCSARVFLVTENIVFWCDEAAWNQIPPELPNRLTVFDMTTRENLRKVFGSGTEIGFDNDPRFHVLFTDKIGIAYNGYFSAEDSADPRLKPSSNGMDILFLNTSLFSQEPEAVIDTLAHEFQHMIHFAYDPNEMSFINEGFSGLSEYLALGSIRDTFIRNYLNDTGRSLIWWPDSGTFNPYYGSSFLFSVYLYDRFGEELIRETVRRPENGMQGLEEALRICGIPYSANEVFLQWAAVLIGQLRQAPVKDLDYGNYRFPQDGIYRDIQELLCGVSERHEVSQYGLRLYHSSCGIPHQIRISGDAENTYTNLALPGGNHAWWSGAVSNAMAVLSHDFDLSGVSGPVRFEYDTNYNIENGYDHYYLLIRDESGAISRLSPSGASDENPSGSNMGKGVTGSSGGVRHESIDLSPWAGQQIRLQFIYLTDTAGVADGVLLDNFRIDAIGFRDDAESTEGGWESAGFRRISASVPQRYALILLRPQADGTSVPEFHTFEGGEPVSVECPDPGCTFGITAIDPDIRSRAGFTVSTSAQ